MTHQNQSSEIAAVVQLLAAEGFEGMANAMQVLLNEAVKLERAEYLNAAPYQNAPRIVAATPTASKTRRSTAVLEGLNYVCRKRDTANSIPQP